MDMLILDQSHMTYPSQLPALNNAAIYLQDFRSEPCQVCGENASGWHCGSITWWGIFLLVLNASWTHSYAVVDFLVKHVRNFFFDLWMKNTWNTSVYERRNVWSHAQLARNVNSVGMRSVSKSAWNYQVRISIPSGWTRMDKNLEESPNPKIEDIFRQIPCVVCQNYSSGIHFGATTCEVITSAFDFPGTRTSLSMCSSRVARVSFDVPCENASRNYTYVRSKTIVKSTLSREIFVERVVFASVSQPECPSKVHALDDSRTCSNTKWSRCSGEVSFSLNCWMRWPPRLVTIRLIDRTSQIQGKSPISIGRTISEVLQSVNGCFFLSQRLSYCCHSPRWQAAKRVAAYRHDEQLGRQWLTILSLIGASAYVDPILNPRFQDKLDAHVIQQIIEIENAYINHLRVSKINPRSLDYLIVAGSSLLLNRE